MQRCKHHVPWGPGEAAFPGLVASENPSRDVAVEVDWGASTGRRGTDPGGQGLEGGLAVRQRSLHLLL